MNVIIYSQEMEPITIVDLPLDTIKLAQQQGALRIAVGDSGKLICRTLVIPVFWPSGEFKYVFVTADEEEALRMNPGWLPGQQQAINDFKKIFKNLKDKIKQLMRGNDA